MLFRSLISHVVKVARHYPFHFTGEIPPHKNPESVDTKLKELYQTELTRAERQRRRRQELSNSQYLRCGQQWVLLATPGTGFIWESEPLRDMRKVPLVLFGHSIKLCARTGGAHSVLVKVEGRAWEKTRSKLLNAALTPSPYLLRAKVQSTLEELEVLPYAGTLQQQRSLQSAINARRRAAGLKRLRP